MSSNNGYLQDSRSWAVGGSAWRWFDACPHCQTPAGQACIDRSARWRRTPHKSRLRRATPLPWSQRQVLDRHPD